MRACMQCGKYGLKPPFFRNNDLQEGTTCAVGLDLQQVMMG